MRSSFMRAMAFPLTTKFLPSSRWFMGSLEFLIDKFGNLSLQEPKLGKVTGSGTEEKFTWCNKAVNYKRRPSKRFNGRLRRR
jgi:hypothetical protein